MAEQGRDAEAFFQDYLERVKDLGPGGEAQFVEDEVPARLKKEVEELIRTNKRTAELWLLQQKMRAEALEVGSRVMGHYRLVRFLGEGSVGVIWEAVDERIQRTVALKMCRGQVMDTRVIDRLVLEAQALGSLTSEGALKFYGIEYHQGVVALVTEVVGEGKTLADMADHPDWEGLSLREKVSKMLPVAHALAEAHGKGILHRDIKPSNLFWDGSKYRLGDFGLASLENQSLGITMTREFTGTYAYAAPEVYLERSTSMASDVFAFGATLFESFFGDRLFQGDQLQEIRIQILSGDLPRGNQLNDLPRPIRAILARCLALDSERRYLNGEEMRRDLEAWVEHRPVAATLPGLVENTRSWIWRNRYPSLVGLALTAALFAALVANQKIRSSQDHSVQALGVAQKLIQFMDPLEAQENLVARSTQLGQLQTVLEKGLDVTPNLLATLWSSLGAGHMSLTNFQEAVGAYEMAISIQPDPRDEIRLAWCLREVARKKNPSEARATLRRAEELVLSYATLEFEDPSQSPFVIAFARNRLATIRFKLPEFETKIPELEQSLREIEFFLGQNELAEAWLESVNKVNLASALVEQMKYEEAWEKFEEARIQFSLKGLGAHPEVFYTYMGKSVCSFQLEEWARAISEINEGILFNERYGRGMLVETVVAEGNLIRSLDLHPLDLELRDLRVRSLKEKLDDPLFEGSSTDPRLKDVFELVDDLDRNH